MEKSTKKQLTISILSIIIVVGGIYLFFAIVFIKRQPTCAMFYDEYKMRGTRYVEYIYKINSKKYAHAVSVDQLKVKNLDDLKQYDCVEIEYSMWFPSISRISDKRIIK